MPRGDVIQYVIDGQNRRIAKKVDGKIVDKWLYAGQLAPLTELDSADDVVAMFSGSYMNKRDTIYQIITDHLGSPRLVVNVSTGDVVQRIDYDEFGNVILDSNPGFQPLGFANGLYDITTKLTRFEARDYDAQIGRWTTKDPIGFGGRLANLFEYAGQDPINFVDPSGWKTCTGTARVLKGNKALIGNGHPGGFGAGVTANSAAVIPSQWGGKANLSPHLSDISGTFSGGQSFTGISDVIGGKSPIPGTPVREALMQLNPGDLILELPSGSADLGTPTVTLTVPDGFPCPEGTQEACPTTIGRGGNFGGHGGGGSW